MSTAQYTHSKSFAALKRIKESIDTNLTSGQYLQLLDTLLYKAIEPIVEHTNQFETYLCSLIGWQEKHNKRKVSLVDRNEFTSIAVTWLMQPKWVKVQKLQSLKLDRGALFEFARTFVQSLNNYENACNCVLEHGGRKLSLPAMLAYKTRIEEAFGSTNSLLSVKQQVQYWLDDADEFKCAILEKYVRLCLTTAQKDYVKYFEKSVCLDDIVQSYILMAARAIDKCDFRQGVLTSHIQNWCLTARTFLAKNSRAEDLPVDAGDNVDDDTESILDTLVRAEETEHVRYLARLVDPKGYARAFLGILESREVLDIQIERQRNGLLRQ